MKKIFLALMIVLVFASMVFSLPTVQKTTLSWDAVTLNVDGTPATDLAGYKIYWATTSGGYINTNMKSVGNVTTVNIQTIAGQLKGTYYFVATAYDTAGNESNFSNEVSASFFVGKAAPKNMVIQ